MKIAINFLKFIGFEAVVMLLLLLLVNNFIGKSESKINADGIGYYDYLPSIFIHKDLYRKDVIYSKDEETYKRIDSLNLYVRNGDYLLNKYTCGTAILESPFFIYTYLRTARTHDFLDGYQSVFQKAIYHSTLFYLFASLLFLKLILRNYKVKYYIVFLTQLLLVIGTNVSIYSTNDAGSHVYSLFAITAFIYFTQSYFTQKRIKYFLIACAFLGLIFLIRQVNIIIILFIPFIAGSYSNLREGILSLFKKPSILILGCSIIVSILFIQCLLWYLQVGSFITYSYAQESFNFWDPQIVNVLFSYNKGLFIYTPMIFISLTGVFWFVLKKEYYLFISWMSFFLFLTYIISSWWCWNYGCCFGLRAFLDFYPVFFIPFALMLNGKMNFVRIFILLISFVTIPVNAIQCFQYKEFILHWNLMDKEKYWKVFLKTDETFKGLVWKKLYDYSNYKVVKKINLGDLTSKENISTFLFEMNSSEIPEFEKVSIVRIEFENAFEEDEKTRILLTINELETNVNKYYHNPFLIHFANSSLNKKQLGDYNYDFTPIISQNELKISAAVENSNRKIKLENIVVKFLQIK